MVLMVLAVLLLLLLRMLAVLLVLVMLFWGLLSVELGWCAVMHAGIGKNAGLNIPKPSV